MLSSRPFAPQIVCLTSGFSFGVWPIPPFSHVGAQRSSRAHLFFLRHAIASPLFFTHCTKLCRSDATLLVHSGHAVRSNICGSDSMLLTHNRPARYPWLCRKMPYVSHTVAVPLHPSSARVMTCFLYMAVMSLNPSSIRPGCELQNCRRPN